MSRQMGRVESTVFRFLAFFLLPASCVACHSQPTSPPIDVGDASGTPCQLACAKLHAAGCLTGGDLCLPACERDQAQGTAAQLDVGCVLNAATLDALNACHACN